MDGVVGEPTFCLEPEGWTPLWGGTSPPQPPGAPSVAGSFLLYLQSLGGDRAFQFLTYGVTAQEIFVLCAGLAPYPFVLGKTLLAGTLSLTRGAQPLLIPFLGKIAEETPGVGFSLRVLQMEEASRASFDEFLRAWSEGSPIRPGTLL